MEKIKKCGIYKFTNKIDGKVYIGQAVDIDVRYHRHICAAFNRNEDNYFYCSLRKYGLDSFNFEILIECPIENLDYWEIFYIKYYCSNDSRFGYNLTEGGRSGTYGYKWTEEQKENQRQVQKQVMLDYFQSEKGKEQARNHSICMKGRKQSKETIEKRRNSLKGTKHSEEWNKKIGDKNRGRKHTELSRKHMSEAHIGHEPGNKGIPLAIERKLYLHNIQKGSCFMTKEGERIYQVIPRRIQEYLDNGYYRCMGRKNRDPWYQKVA